jgi:sec-independent protein translocase protein TatA
MLPHLGIPELLIILVIVLVIFGASRLTDIMGAVGKGVSEFRKGTAEVDNKPEEGTPKIV